jgi:hypothetical protein
VSGWEALHDADEPVIPDADGRPMDCPSMRGIYECTRRAGHPGRHLASIGYDRIVAAWPGDHAPTAADIEAVPS